MQPSDHMLSNVSERWIILAVLFLARTVMGFQFQSVAALSSSVVNDFRIDYAQLGLLIGLYLFPGIVIAYPGGFLGQYFGDKRIAVFGMALMIAGGLLTATSEYTAVLFRTFDQRRRCSAAQRAADQDDHRLVRRS